MKYGDFYKDLCAYAPISLSDALCEREGMRDNSGEIVGCDGDVTGVIFALDLTKGAVAAAILWRGFTYYLFNFII